MNNGFRFFIPKENIAAIRAGDDKFASWPIEIDAFDGGIVAVSLIAVNNIGHICPLTGEEVDVFIIVTGQQFGAIEIVNGAGDVGPNRRIQLKIN